MCPRKRLGVGIPESSDIKWFVHQQKCRVEERILRSRECNGCVSEDVSINGGGHLFSTLRLFFARTVPPSSAVYGLELGPSISCCPQTFGAFDFAQTAGKRVCEGEETVCLL